MIIPRSLFPWLAALLYVLASVYLETDIDAKEEELASQWSMKHAILRSDPVGVSRMRANGVVKMKRRNGFNGMKWQEKQKRKYIHARKSDHAKSASTTVFHKGRDHNNLHTEKDDSREVRKHQGGTNMLVSDSHVVSKASVQELVPSLPPVDASKNAAPTVNVDNLEKHDADQRHVKVAMEQTTTPSALSEGKIDATPASSDKNTTSSPAASDENTATSSASSDKNTTSSPAASDENTATSSTSSDEKPGRKTNHRSLWKHAPQLAYQSKPARGSPHKPLRGKKPQHKPLPKFAAPKRAFSNFTFTSPDWLAQFDAAQAALEKTPSLPKHVVRKLQGSAGHSDALLTPAYALVANACVDTEGVRVFEVHPGRLLAAARMNHSDFYSIALRSSNASLEHDVAMRLPHLAVLRPQCAGRLAFLQAAAPLLRLAAHPEQFPRVSEVLVVGVAAPAPDSWRETLMQALLGAFPNATRPAVTYLSRSTVQDVQCGASLTLLRAASEETGPIPDFLSADLLRAAAYQLAGVAPHALPHTQSETQTETQAQTRLVVKVLHGPAGGLLNHKAVMKHLRAALKSIASVSDLATEGLSGVQQVRAFEEADVLVGAHSNALANIVFMLPNSAVIELFPPHYSSPVFDLLSVRERIHYTAISGYMQGNVNNPPKGDCEVDSYRDVFFNVKSEDIEAAVLAALQRVNGTKYH